MEQWKQRLKQAREARGLKKTEFARQVGVSNATATDWEKASGDGGIKEISGVKLVKVCLVLNIPANWLLHGGDKGADLPGDLGESRAEPDFDQNVRAAPLGARPIPVISAVQAGLMKEMNAPYEVGDGYAIEYTANNLSRWAFALEIDGLSMMPEFRPGDRVIIDPELSPNPGDFVVAKNGKEEATFKKYRPRGVDQDGTEIFELVPLNEDYATMRSDETHLEIIGVMTELRKQYRRMR